MARGMCQVGKCGKWEEKRRKERYDDEERQLYLLFITLQILLKIFTTNLIWSNRRSWCHKEWDKTKIIIFSVDTNLIQLDTDDVLATNTNATYADNDDDIIFEVNFKHRLLRSR